MTDWLFPHTGWQKVLVSMCVIFIVGLVLILRAELKNEKRH